MLGHLTKYQKGGLIAFVILAISVGIALYQSDQSSEKAEQVRVANEQNRYKNCIVANEAITQLNLQGSIQKQTLLLAISAAEERAKEGNDSAATRAKRYDVLYNKLHKSAELECTKP